MSKQIRINAKEAEKMLLSNGFELIRTKGSHRIYKKDIKRIVIPFHNTEILHPKIISELLEAITN